MSEPRLYVGGLSGRVFCTTDYTEHAGTVRANTKHDVTDDFERAALELGWVPPLTESHDIDVDSDAFLDAVDRYHQSPESDDK